MGNGLENGFRKGLGMVQGIVWDGLGNGLGISLENALGIGLFIISLKNSPTSLCLYLDDI